MTPSHRAVVEEKPEVRKAGGVYYTPTYIVDYIVQHTVGALLEGKSVRQLANLTILDPACGSGSFLLGAYQYLLDWYREQYGKDPLRWAKSRPPRLYEAQGGDWNLTMAERKRILLKHIYGVDIDPQAVEVTKLSLLLKVLEGESEETLGTQLRLFQERALPDLANNIKCGNSLIGPDFYLRQQMSFLSEEEHYRINVFDWEKQFPEIMAAGGFDVVIGNPPWGGDIDRELDYFHDRYPATTQEHTDSFKLFIEAGVHFACSGGLVSMIVPNTLLRQRRVRDARVLMLQGRILRLVDLGEDVFRGVVAPSCIFVLEKLKSSERHQVHILDFRKLLSEEKARLLGKADHMELSIEQHAFQLNADLEFMAPLQKPAVPARPLGSLDELRCRDAGINYQRVGVGMREKGRSDLSKRLLYEGERQKPGDKMYWKGSDISRYWIRERTERFCRPNYRDFIRPNEVVRLNEEVYDTTPKILLRQTADRITATVDYRGVWFGRSIIAIVPREQPHHRIEYFLGLLNSRYFAWLYNQLVREKGRVFAQVKLSKLKQLPIRIINFGDGKDVAYHDRMANLVGEMLRLHRQLPAAKLTHDKDVIQRQIDATDRQIDQLVYELYELTDEEIRIVEEAAG